MEYSKLTQKEYKSRNNKVGKEEIVQKTKICPFWQMVFA